MSILVNADTKVICQGITGSAGAFHTKGCLDYGTQMVGGVTPGKGGQKVPSTGCRSMNTVAKAEAGNGCKRDSLVFVPPPFAADSAIEAAADAGIELIVADHRGRPRRSTW